MNMNKNHIAAKLDSLYYLPLKNNKEKSTKNQSPNKYLVTKEMFELDTNKKIPFKLIRSNRRKTSEIIVDKNKIILRVPFDKPLSQIQSIIRKKIRWILEKQRRQKEKEKEREIVKPTFLPGSKLPYLGKNHKLKTIIGSGNDKIEFADGEFIIKLKNNYSEDENKKIVKSSYENWILEQGKVIFKQKIKEFSKTIGVYPRKISIKNLRNRWGSLTKNGAIVINVNLIKVPEKIIDYIIIHELCHLIIQGHSHKFWFLLHKYVPDYRDRVEWLARNTEGLIEE
jgi:predicted metal-dependent hydrolase